MDKQTVRTKGKKVQITLALSTFKQIKEKAEEQGRSYSGMCAKLIEEALKG